MGRAIRVTRGLTWWLVGGTWMFALGAQPIPAAAQDRRVAPPDQPVAEYKREPPGLIAEPDLITRAVIFADRHFGNGDITNGFYPDLWNMIPGAGWISAGPGYRQWYSKDRVFVDGSVALSWQGYKTAQARVELPRLANSRLALGSQVRWQDFTQVAFFGEGPEALESNASEYRLGSKNVVGFATLRPAAWVDIDAEIGWLEPSIRPRAGIINRNRLETHRAFPENAVFAFSDQPTFIHSAVSVTADTRDYPGHATRGGLVRAAAAHYSDRESQSFSFTRYEAEAARFMPIAGSRVVIALHGWLMASDTNNGQVVPFYLQPSLGGHNSLRGYAEYRFHDRNLLLVNAEGRIAITTHVDAAVFVDAGNVASRVGDLNLEKRSYGTGLRMHSRRQTYLRLDVARSDEGWRLVLRLTDPLNLVRLSKRTATAPFVP